MLWRSGRVSKITLIGLALIGLVGFAVAERSRVVERQPYYRQKVEASRKAQFAQKAIRDARGLYGMPIDVVNDPNQTGLVGHEFTITTTDRGSLTAKLTSLDPNFAGVVVELLKKAGAKKGDVIAVALTGSLPALNIAVISAAEVLGLEPVVITSVGASMWGANDPAFSWLDMEAVLADKGVLRTVSSAASLGGGDDKGRGLSPEGRRLLEESIERNGVLPILEESLDKSVGKRIEIYDELADGRRIAAFVNVGGGLASLGSSQNAKLIPAGLSKNLGMKNFPRKGVLILMSERGIPIIHLLDVLSLAEEYGLSVSPVPLPEPGEGLVFEREKYNVITSLIVLIVYALIVIVFVRIDVGHYLFRKKRLSSGA